MWSGVAVASVLGRSAYDVLKTFLTIPPYHQLISTKIQ